MRIQKSDFDSQYVRQVNLLLKISLIVAKEFCVAIKGGTAINLFLRGLPRLSVDIDLVYLPIEDQGTSLINIEKGFLNIKHEIIRRFHRITVIEKRIRNSDRLSKLIVGEPEKIKIEPNENFEVPYCLLKKETYLKRLKTCLSNQLWNIRN